MYIKTTTMRKFLLLLFAITVYTVSWAQTSGRITGKVTDNNTNEPLAGATVTIRETGASTATDNAGMFSFSNVRTGNVALIISFVGYADVIRSVRVTDATTNVDVTLSTSSRVSDEVVVTASRRPEKITRAPASISVINARDLEQVAGHNPGELASKIQGVEFYRTGVAGVGINARGFSNAFNAKFFQMTDGRNSMMAGGSGLPSGIMNTVVKEDIERLEIVLGPNSALYGPNAHNGVANTITKDPRRYEGTTLVLTRGNQDVFSGRFRHAHKINNKWAYKLTGEHTSGKEFEFYDSIYAGGGVFGPAVAIPERIPSFRFKHLRGEAHAYYSVTPSSDIIVSYGGSKNDFLSVNNTGRNQIRDWTFSYLQARFVSPRFFAQAYETWTNVGQSYGIPGYTRDFWNRTHSTITDRSDPRHFLFPDEAQVFATRLGNRFKEESKRFNGEAQYNYTFENLGLYAVAGATYQKDNPKTFGTSLIDANQTFEITQYGGALQLEKTLPADFKIVTAARLDNHSLFGNMFAPKVGLVKGVPGGAVRLTWAKAYAAPIILFQRASVFGLVFGNGSGVHYIPNGASVNDEGARQVTVSLQPEQISTWEAGYKGTIAEKLYIDINGYYGKSKNFLSPAITVGGRALSVGDIPIDQSKLLIPGTVNSSGQLAGAAFLTYFNYGEVTSYGVDLGVNYYFSGTSNFTVKYSWFGSDITEENIKNDANRDGFVSLEERNLNAPRHRVVAGLNFQNLFDGKAYLNIGGRWIQQYDFYSGSQIGTAEGEGRRGVVYGGINPINNQPRNYFKNFNHGALGGFTTFDLSTGYKFSEFLSVGGSISNIFDVEQREFVGSPSIGRLYSVEVKTTIPTFRK